MNTNKIKIERVYVDANVFLNPILYDVKENLEAAAADSFLKKIIHKNVEAFTSFLTRDEFVWIVRKNLGQKIAI